MKENKIRGQGGLKKHGCLIKVNLGQRMTMAIMLTL